MNSNKKKWVAPTVRWLPFFTLTHAGKVKVDVEFGQNQPVDALVTSLRAALGARLVAYLGSLTETATVQRWARGEVAPAPHILDRLRVAHDVASLITMHAPPSIAQVWFQGMNPLLDDDAPARLLRDGDLARDGVRVLVAAQAFAVHV